MDGGFLELAQQCAPATDSAELAAIISVESDFNPLMIRINSDRALKTQPQTKAEAIEIVTTLQINGQDADLGLGGLDFQSLNYLGLTIADAFDPCKNLAATARLLATYYASARAGASKDPKRKALWTFYGRGNPEPGRIIGYDREIANAQEKLTPRLRELKFQTGKSNHLPDNNRSVDDPASTVNELADTSPETEGYELQNSTGVNAVSPEQNITASWDVFSSTRKSQLIIFNR